MKETILNLEDKTGEEILQESNDGKKKDEFLGVGGDTIGKYKKETESGVTNYN